MKRTELTVDAVIADAKNHLGLSKEEVDQFLPIFNTQVQSLNRLRAIKVDMAVEPDVTFAPGARP